MVDRTSWQTSWAGLTTALGTFLALLLPKIWPSLPAEEVVQIVGAGMAVIGIIWFGLAARDDNVSSEGRAAPKALKVLVCLLLPALLLGGPVATMGGCAQFSRVLGNPDATAREQYRDAVNTYDVAVSVATIAVDTDLVDLDTAEAMGRAEQAAYDELVLMRRALESDDLKTFNDALGRFRRLLNALRVLGADTSLATPRKDES